MDKVDELCNLVECDSVGVKECEKLVNILEEAAKSTLPNIIKSTEAKIWDNDDELVQSRNIRDSIDRNTNPKEFKNITKKIRNSPVEFLFNLEKIYIKTYYISLEREFYKLSNGGLCHFFHFGQKFLSPD